MKTEDVRNTLILKISVMNRDKFLVGQYHCNYPYTVRVRVLKNRVIAELECEKVAGFIFISEDKAKTICHFGISPVITCSI